MKVSLTGLLRRLKGRKDQMFMVEEFIKHYQIAKKAYREGDKEPMDEFLNLYVTEND